MTTKTVSVFFANHFDLTWRRCWERSYRYQGAQYASYQEIEELCLNRNLELAEQGEGAYLVEQSLTLRTYLIRYPEALPRLKALYERGLFEVCGAGEAIIDVNLCSFETMCRNLASGVAYCRDVLGMPPLLACHDDGFGSSAQFPQVIRQCGLPGIQGMSYNLPDNTYWQGLDGSTILVWRGAPGRNYFFDHCYHEPCRKCRGLAPGTCHTCNGTGLDLPQNFYPPFESAPATDFSNGLAQYCVRSEEMLPPDVFSSTLRRWEATEPDVRYIWATPRHLASLWRPLTLLDPPPANQIASRVENNPVQTGCLVSRIRIKQEARRCESLFYGWESALALSCPNAAKAAAWATAFLELPLFFFHDAVTGTHQDEAYAELLDRMAILRRTINSEAQRTLQQAGWTNAEVPAPAVSGSTLQVFPARLGSTPLRIPLAEGAWREAKPLVAVTAEGRRWPVVHDWHPWSPPMHEAPGRLIRAVGSTARTRPDTGPSTIEVNDLPALSWQELRLESAAEPSPLDDRELRNAYLSVTFTDRGVATIRDLQTNATAQGDDLADIGGLVLEEDEGDPWGTRRKSSFCRPLTPFTRRLGARRFEGYSEAYFGGHFEPNLRFGREEDPSIFALEWMVTVRLLDAARRVDFSYEIFWKSENRRLRAVFPVQSATDSAWYSIPGGVLERPRYDQTETCLWSPNGDWPALHFAAAQPAAGQASGWAVINYGTPSARVADGRIMMSLLRSPGFGHCLERYAQDYPMPTSGLRDGGWHHFRLSLAPHAGAGDISRLAGEASALNLAIPAAAAPTGSTLSALPFQITGQGIELVAVKLPFDGGQEQILRLLNNQPVPSALSLKGNGGRSLQVTPCLMTEEQCGEPAIGKCLSFEFKPFEARTFRIRNRQGNHDET